MTASSTLPRPLSSALRTAIHSALRPTIATTLAAGCLTLAALPAISAIEPAPGLQVTATAEKAQGRILVIIDASVKEQVGSPRNRRSNIQQLTLDGTKDGISQITEILSQEKGLAAVHILTRGGADYATLGTEILEPSSLAYYSKQLTTWQSAIKSGGRVVLHVDGMAVGQKDMQLKSQLREMAGIGIRGNRLQKAKPQLAAGKAQLKRGGGGTPGQFIVGDGSGGGGGGAPPPAGYGYSAGNGGTGGGGNDSLAGTAGDDVIFGDGSGGGGGGAFVPKYAGGGNAGGGGVDTIDGGAGNDVLFGDGIDGSDGGSYGAPGGAGGAGGGGGGGGGGNTRPGGAPGGNGGIGGGGGGGGNSYSGQGGNGGYGGGGGGGGYAATAGIGGGFGAGDGVYSPDFNISGGGGGGGYHGDGGLGGRSYGNYAGDGGYGGATTGSGNGGNGGAYYGGGGGGGGFGGGDGGNGGDVPAPERANRVPGSDGFDGGTATYSIDDVAGVIWASVKAGVDGGAYNDLNTGGGNDTLDGGPGSDDLFGFGGTNTFLFELDDVVAADIDTIHDFNAGTGNVIDLQQTGVTFDAATINGFLAGQTPTRGGIDRTLTVGCAGELTIVVKNIARDLVIGDFNTGAVSCNSPPVAQDDDVAVPEDDTLNGDVTADNGNGPDSDPDMDALTVATVNGIAANVGTQLVLSSGALLTINASGSFSYDTNGQFNGLAVGATATDSATYVLEDTSMAQSNQATLTITVNGTNDDPVAQDDAAGVSEDSSVSGNLFADNGSGVDSDPDMDPLSVALVNGSAGNIGSQFALGSGALLTANADGSFTYDTNGQFEYLAPGATAGDSFTYVAGDGNSGQSNEATASITIDGVNDQLTLDTNAGGDTTEGGTLVIENSLLAGSDVDDDATQITYTVTADPVNGSLVLAGRGGAVTSFTQSDIDNLALSYVHDDSITTTDSFGFSLADGGEDGTVPVTGTFNINITPSDTDGVPGAVEDQVPNANGSGNGDGNGDGIADRYQDNVTSLPADTGDYFTLTSSEEFDHTSVVTSPAPAGLPSGVSLPYGMISFVMNGLPAGESVDFELHMPFTPLITGYFKQDSAGNWQDIATSVTHTATQTIVSFTITDGGEYDRDGAVDGSITDPGGPGKISIPIPTLSGWTQSLMVMLLGITGFLSLRRRKRPE